MIIHLVAGGPTEYIPNLKQWKDEESVTWVGIDKGVQFLLEAGIIPKKAFGDFDSVTKKELAQLSKELPDLSIFPSEKNEIDSELGMNWALEQGPTKIRMFGVTGGRLDHFFGNVQLLINSLEKFQCKVEIIDKQNIIYLESPGTYHISKLEAFRYVSFVPITKEVKKLTLKGFKYELLERDISWGETLCISNELILNSSTFSFIEGILMVIRSSDNKLN
ncbi:MULTISPECIES: thiamine diphosphokinase [Bacillus]|uniref:thiamine diphosphokinase n=1 Tax=Bacillus TaxID=1386 RepID=UPI000BB99D00|nr:MULTISPECIES: thiamine diphosphokinase [Bacillus]